MIQSLAAAMTEAFLKNKVIEKENVDVYTYGCELLISEIICTAAVMGIGIFFGKGAETLLYLIVYTLIRVYAGGYHAESYRNCIIVFSTLYLLLLFLTGWVVEEKTIYLLLVGVLAADAVVWKLAPMEDRRKPLEDQEKAHYRKKTRVRLAIANVCGISIYLCFPEYQEEIAFLFMAVCEIAILLLLGIVKNRKRNTAEKNKA